MKIIKTGNICLVFFILMGLNVQPHGLFSQSVFSRADSVFPEYTTNAKKSWYTDSWASSITTVNGKTYFVYVDSNLHAQIGMMTSSNTVTTALDNTYKVTDDGHNEFCLALDKEGYIHLMGNMHCDTLRYWRSKKPYDILSGFERISGAIPGTFSYYFFRKSKSGELFMACRAGARDDWWGFGGRGVGLYKYNTATKKWEIRGAVAPGKKYSTIYLEETGVKGTGYQMFKADIRFDMNDRLHFTVTTNFDTSSTSAATHAVYACSDDYGITWKKAGGANIPLPMSLVNMDVIDGYPNAGMGEHSKLLLNSMNQAAVVYSIDGKTFYRYISNSVWQPRIELINNAQWGRFETLYDQSGYFTVVSGNTVVRFAGYGLPVLKKNISASIYRWDLDALMNENIYRGIEWSSSTGIWKIFRMYFDYPTENDLLNQPANNTPAVFPNPNHGNFRIELPEGKNTTVEVYNLFGQLFYSGIHSGVTIFHLNNLSKGLYFLRTKTDDRFSIQKFVVE